MNKLIDRLEKGHLYKVKEYPNWDDSYTIFCPKSNRIIRYHDDCRTVCCMFVISGYGKNAKLDYKIASVRVRAERYIKHLSVSDYMKVNTLLKKSGFKYNRKLDKLVGVKYAEEGTSI